MAAIALGAAEAAARMVIWGYRGGPTALIPVLVIAGTCAAVALLVRPRKRSALASACLGGLGTGLLLYSIGSWLAYAR